MPVVIKSSAEIVERKIFKGNVVLLSLKPEKRLPLIKSGQFLHLALDPYQSHLEWPESRVFSIASVDYKENTIKILISVKGNFTQRMYNDLQINSNVWVKFPYGYFVIPDSLSTIVLIAGGTGIAPFIPFLQKQLLANVKKDIHLFYGIKSKNVLVYDELLDELIKADIGFKMYIYSEDKNDLSVYANSFLDINNIYNIVKETNPNYYISGPFQMINSFVSFLKDKQICADKILIDEW